MEEMRTLTEITLSGLITFEASFRLRTAILKSISIKEVQEIVAEIPLQPELLEFVQCHQDQCAVVTGNLEVWIRPLIEKLGCKVFTSRSVTAGDQLVGVDYIMHKSKPVQILKSEYNKVVTIGESMNDIPMFEVADIGVAFGGVHEPVDELIMISDYVVYDGGALCRLLNTLL